MTRGKSTRSGAGLFDGCQFDNCSVDSQFTEEGEEEPSFLEACMDCDEDALYELILDGLTWEQVNERDKSGRTGLSHACGNGFMPILELLAQVEEVDPNLPDNDGNTPLILAAQAGHDDIVNYLLHHFRRLRIDQCNHLGFTALMKASIQGRTKCAKHLLFAGANPNRRDHGRRLCAEEWARFCGRHNCADAISKYIHSKKYFFKKTFVLSGLREKWSSEPDLAEATRKSTNARENKSESNWIKRHLSLRRKKRGNSDGEEHGLGASLSQNTRSSSSPLLVTTPPPEDEEEAAVAAAKQFRRPSCVDGVIPLPICRPRHQRAGSGGRLRRVHDIQDNAEPPKIMATDFDKEKADQTRVN